MKKILILTNLDVGLYNFRKELLRALLSVPYEVHIALPEGDFVPKMEKMGCIFHPVSMERRGMNPLHEMDLMKQYRRIIRKVKPDAALTYTIKPNIYGGAALGKARVPYISNITGLGSALQGNGVRTKVIVRLYRFGMRRVNCLFFQNQGNEAFFQKNKIAQGKHLILPGSGVNLDHFSYQDFPGEDEPVSLLFISRIMREKGIEQFLEMTEVIHKEYPGTKFRILGFYEEDDPAVDSYRKKIEELEQRGILTFEGMQDDVRPFIAKSQGTILPSFHEGMSNVCLESAASGRPVITTDVMGCRETVDDGKTGLIVKVRDTEDLIRGVRQYLDLPYEQRVQMGIEARRKMEREFDRKIVVQKYLDELERILEV